MKRDAEAAAWVEKAEEDYRSAETLARKRVKPVPGAVCFHCQQAAEKYLKSFLTLRRVDFPKTHDLIVLKTLAAPFLPEAELVADLLLYLNEFSVQFRYPGEHATVGQARRAIGAIREVRKFFAVRLPGL